MMLSWKMAACLAAGNTVVMKPAQVSPLTALKFAELSVKAGFPPGVINILPGTGAELLECCGGGAHYTKGCSSYVFLYILLNSKDRLVMSCLYTI